MEVSNHHSRIPNSSLSPPPRSPDRVCPPAEYRYDNQPTQAPSFGVYNQPSLPQTNAPVQGQSNPGQAPPAEKVKKPRKKKDDTAPAAADGETKPKKQRKPKVPKDPNAPPPKRRKKNEDVPGGASKSNLPVNPQSASAAPTTSQSTLGFGPTSTAQPVQSNAPAPILNPGYAQVGKIDPAPAHAVATPQFGTIHQHNRTQSANRAAYDPIRSASMENARQAGTPTPGPTSTHQSPIHVRAAPSYTNLHDPSHPTSISHVNDRTPPSRPATAEPRRKTPPKLAPAPTPPPAMSSSGLAPVPDKSVTAPDKPTTKEKVTSRQPSPKPAPVARKKATPPMPRGNGLLSGADFGNRGSAEPKEYAQVPNDCIVIDVPITGKTNNYVNYLKEVESKYGFDVAHPRLAEHQRRMAQMAAAGAALESAPGTADEMSLDNSSGEDSDVDMGGQNGEESATATATDAKKKRVTKADKYDLEDEFVDDTEQAWSEQALASKDGYFVWSGPLIPEGEDPAVQRADGTMKRGRGAARGRGSRGGAGSRSTKTAEGGEKKASRGGTAPRKPRFKKSDREAMEKEKAEREKMGAATSVTNGASFPGVVGGV